MSLDGESVEQLPSTDVAKCSETVATTKDSFVYGFMDLFSGYEESWSGGELSSSVVSRAFSRSKQVYEGVEKNFKPKEKSTREDSQHAEVVSTLAKLESVKEVDEKVLPTTFLSKSLSDDLARSSSDTEKDKEVLLQFIFYIGFKLALNIKHFYGSTCFKYDQVYKTRMRSR